MKVLMNGHNSVQLTPVWPVMKGYGEVPENLYDEPMPPHAGPNGSYEPDWREQLTAVVRRPRVESKRAPLTYQLPQDRPQATSKTAVVTGTTLPTPGSESEAPVAPGAPSETIPMTAPTHPYATPSTEVAETTDAGAELPAGEVSGDTGGGGGGGYEPPTMALQTEDYVGGTELGPEAGNGVVVTTIEASKKSRWPIYVGVGAGVAVLGLVGLAVAYSGRK